jgi:hypothetical protein
MATVKQKTKSTSTKAAVPKAAAKVAVKAISEEKNLNLTAQLQDYFGFDKFKDPQEDIIQN